MFECYSCSLRFDKHSFCGSSSQWERQRWSWEGQHSKKEGGSTIKRSSYGKQSRWRQGKGCLNKWSPESDNCSLCWRKAPAGFRKKVNETWTWSLPCPRCVDCRLIKVGFRFRGQAGGDSVMEGEPRSIPSRLRKQDPHPPTKEGICGKLSFSQDQTDAINVSCLCHAGSE